MYHLLLAHNVEWNDFVIFLQLFGIQNCDILCCALSCSQISYWTYVNSAKELFERLLVDNGANTFDSIEFTQGEDTAVLNVVDLHTFEQDQGKLSNDTMDWFVFWFNPHVSHLDVCIVNSYMTSQLMTMMNDEHFSMAMVEGFYCYTTTKCTFYDYY